MPGRPTSFLAGLLFRRVGGAAALLGFVAGVGASVLVAFGKEIFSLEEGVSFMWIIPSSFLASLAVSFLAGRFLPSPSEDQLAALCRAQKSR